MNSNPIVSFVFLFLIFVPLERLFALRRQRVFRQGWLTDVAHFFISYFLVQLGVFLVFITLATLLRGILNPQLHQAIAAQPLWLQFPEALLVAELAFYFAHRLTHQIPFLWRFHVVHHTIAEMDWLAAARLHPLDQIFVKSVTILPLYILGFTEATFGAYLLVIAVQAIFVHANLRLRFGPLRWLISTPEFHHWHHAADPAAHNRNFAGQLPLLDWLFGTLYMPKRRMPQAYGVSDAVPSRYLRQMAYPFQRTRLGAPSETIAGRATE
jgi:sterol desaturase/sphingolipid hydroxylase (fatty acid hydroxylase superfamily)